MTDLQREIAAIIKRYSRENVSDTPDSILARYSERCLEAFEETSRAREEWHGTALKIDGVVKQREGKKWKKVKK